MKKTIALVLGMAMLCSSGCTIWHAAKSVRICSRCDIGTGDRAGARCNGRRYLWAAGRIYTVGWYRKLFGKAIRKGPCAAFHS